MLYHRHAAWLGLPALDPTYSDTLWNDKEIVKFSRTSLDLTLSFSPVLLLTGKDLGGVTLSREKMIQVQ